MRLADQLDLFDESTADDVAVCREALETIRPHAPSLVEGVEEAMRGGVPAQAEGTLLLAASIDLPEGLQRAKDTVLRALLPLALGVGG